MLRRIICLFCLGILPAIAYPKDRLTIIGDSHTYGFFGDALEQSLATDYQVSRIGSCGARAESFFNSYTTKCGLRWTGENKNIKTVTAETPKVSEILSSNPSHIVIALGTNYLSANKLQIEKEVLKLVRALPPQASCQWLGAPDIQSKEHKMKIQEINRTIQASLKGTKCEFVDISSLVSYPTSGGDGIHFGKIKGFELGKLASQQIRNLINSKPPEPSKRNIDQRTEAAH